MWRVLLLLLAVALLANMMQSAATPVKLPPTNPSATGDHQFVTPAGNILLY
jgi:hypothetical protein